MAMNKALLGGTLFVTFASGGLTGYVAGSGEGPAAPIQSVEYVYPAEFRRMEAKGYSAAELDEARGIYGAYLDEYRTWWDVFQEAYQSSLDPVESRFETRKSELEARVRARLAREQDR